MSDESGEGEVPQNVPEAFKITPQIPRPLEGSSVSSVVDKPDTDQADKKKIETESNALALEDETKSLFNDYTAAIGARVDEITRGDYQDSDVFENVKRITHKREGFLWKNKREVSEKIGGKWKNLEEGTDITKFSRLDFPYSDLIKYKVLLMGNEQQNDSLPVLEVDERPKRTTLILDWNQNSSDVLQTSLPDQLETTRLVSLAEQLGGKDKALRYQIRVDLESSIDDLFQVEFAITQEDQITEGEAELQKAYDGVSAWDTDAGDGPSMAMMRERDAALAEIGKELKPLKEARFHTIAYSFDAEKNRFEGVSENSNTRPESIDASSFVHITKGLLSLIPTDTRKSVHDGSSVVTLSLPGEKIVNYAQT